MSGLNTISCFCLLVYCAIFTLCIFCFLVESHKNTVRTAARLQGNFSSILSEYNIGKLFRGYSIFADDK